MAVGITDFAAFLAGAAGGALVGWRLRDRYARSRDPWTSEQELVRHSLGGLQDATMLARSIVHDHKQQIHEIGERIEKRWQDQDDVPPIVQELIRANAWATKGLDKLTDDLGDHERDIRWWLREHYEAPRAPTPNAKSMRRSVSMLNDLRDLASHLAGKVEGHRQHVGEVSEDLKREPARPVDGIVAAVSSIIHAASQMQEEIVAAERKLQIQAANLEQQTTDATIDPLTGLANRRALDREMASCEDLWRHAGQHFALMLFDLDRFKQINDRFGHQAGDAVLKDVATRLRDQVCRSDFVARYGGEELALILVATPLKETQIVALRILDAIRSTPFYYKSQQLAVTASIGLAHVMAGETCDSVLVRADEALYAAKKYGRDRAYFHDGQKLVPIRPSTAGMDVTAIDNTFNDEETVRPPDEAAATSSPSPSVPAKTRAEPSADDGLDVSATSLANKTTFFHSVHRRLAEWKRGGPRICIVLVRVDHEMYHKLQANIVRLLERSIVQTLAATIREMDQPCEYDTGTYGVLLPDAQLTDAVNVAERIRAAIEHLKIRLEEDDTLSVTASLGVAQAESSDNAAGLIKRAAEAVLTSAANGGNRVEV